MPIGNSSDPFNTTFDGGSFTISDLYINRASTDRIGLFGMADAGSVIRRVRLVSVNVTGGDFVGGLVGFNDNTATVTASYALGSVAGSGSAIGGLIGLNHNTATVTASYATGSVSGSSVGGLVGYNYGSSGAGGRT